MLFNKTWSCWLIGVAIGSAFVTIANCAKAQSDIVPDNTLNTENSTVNPNFGGLPIEVITGGAIRGQNLFHSFQQFNVGEARGAYFFSPSAEIQNILARVTGSDRSEILGTLGTFGNSNPNLFLINPNGIIFGQNASLDVGGSFVATTANSLKFTDGTEFSSIVSQNTPLLTISVPLGLQFNRNPGKIIAQGSGHNLTYSFRGSVIRNDSPSLQVQPGKTLALVGGDLVIEGGNLRAESGRIELLSVASPSLVSLTPTNSGFTLGYSDVHNFGDIELSKKASVDVSGESGGEIQVQGKRVSLRDGSSILSITEGSKPGGDFTINAAESVELIGESVDGQFASSLFTETQNAGSAGNLRIATSKLTATDGAYISTYTFSDGRGGDMTIGASDSVEITGSGLYESGLYAATAGMGQSGNLTINTHKLTVRDGGLITSNTSGSGKAGILQVNASESVEIFGNSTLTTKTTGTGDAGNLAITTKRLIIRDRSEVSSSTSGNDGRLLTKRRGEAGNLNVIASDFVEVSGVNSGLISFSLLSTGNAGNLTIDTRGLLIRDGATVSTSSIGTGRGGNLKVTATDFVEVSGNGISFAQPLGEFTLNSNLSSDAGSTQDAGSLTIKTGQLIIRDGANVSAQTNGLGKGGDIQIETDSLLLANQGSISSESVREQGKAGNIFLNVRNILEANNGSISTSTDRSSGGAITIIAKNIRLYGNSDIRTDVASGAGSGGNITLNANSIIAFDDSDILAFARDGRGGNITLNTPAFFGSGYQVARRGTNLDLLDGNNRVDVNATGAIASGNIFIPDTSSIQNNLSELSQTPIDTNALIASSCIARSGNKPEGTFTITGAGGLPNRPGDVSVSSYPTGTVRHVQTDHTLRSWQKGDPIVEPSGVYRLSSGQLILSRECL
ncbi:filamentous hemagglutinin N-terminal domain-containing protein [Scytonema sp. NUACC26]|uniref:two-partner secretion domain-containing protein n=1 Tax=Scytonema sp. NUACC26 TaxID=3140176 RepID=UPI0034DC752D